MLISKLSKQHDRKAFDCGQSEINRFLRQLASQVTKRHESVIYVAHEGNTIMGFYTLSSSQINKTDDPQQLKKYSGHIPVPCILIGRLAVDINHQGKGIGTDLLAHALITIKSVADLVGTAFVVVDAKDEAVKAFYEGYGFTELQANPMRLCYPVSQII